MRDRLADYDGIVPLRRDDGDDGDYDGGTREVGENVSVGLIRRVVTAETDSSTSIISAPTCLAITPSAMKLLSVTYGTSRSIKRIAITVEREFRYRALSSLESSKTTVTFLRSLTIDEPAENYVACARRHQMQIGRNGKYIRDGDRVLHIRVKL